MKKSSHVKVAFLLNENAKSVTPNFKKKLQTLVSSKDLYFCKNMNDAQEHIKTILDERYPYVFCGGGDGTIVYAINAINQLGANLAPHLLPKIGVLRLGTGNALAKVLMAHNPLDDIKHVLAGKALKPLLLSMVQDSNNNLAPFAGMGYDGEIMNDFYSLKNVFFNTPLRKLFSSVIGFSIAGIFKTLPRQFTKKPNKIIIRSNHECYKIVKTNKGDEEFFIGKNEILYEGFAPFMCIGTIPYVGYSFKMFPFASKRPGFMHLRVCDVTLKTCLANLYPAIWDGYFRHKDLHDFLVKDVSIESQTPLAYQFAGDAMGHEKNLYFQTSQNPASMVCVNWEDRKYNLPNRPLMTPLS